jgi:hypothetical protein
LQSAVSPICNRQGVDNSKGPGSSNAPQNPILRHFLGSRQRLKEPQTRTPRTVDKALPTKLADKVVERASSEDALTSKTF